MEYFTDLGYLGLFISCFLAATFIIPFSPEVILGILIGGGIGTYIALKIEMTALPQLVAAFHSLVGLAAVFVATSAFYSPGSYGIINEYNEIFPSSLVEMSIGVAIGAITLPPFTQFQYKFLWIFVRLIA